MKIIGTTSDGYLVIATGQELAACDGYELWRHPDAIQQKFLIGTTFDPKAALKYLTTLRSVEAEVIAGAKAAYSLAVHLQTHIPSFVTAPPTPPADDAL